MKMIQKILGRDRWRNQKIKIRTRSSEAYKRTAKPRKTLPKRTAMLVAAPGT